MQSGYGGVSEIQQFMVVDASAGQSPFSISSTQNPSAASPSVTGGGQELQHLAGAAPFYKLINPFHTHQHIHNPASPPPPPPMQFPHFHSVPITQQLFTRLSHPQHHQHQLQLFHQPEPENYSRGGIMPSFLAANMNFKLAADDSSCSGIFQDDDASESRLRPWHRQEDCHIKEPFWRRPVDQLDCIDRNKCKRYKDKEPEEPLHSGYNNNYKRSHESVVGHENSQSELFFSELEAIYRPGGSTDADGAIFYKNNNVTNQTTASGSALTGEDRPIMPARGAEQPNSSIKSTRQQSSRRFNISAFLSGLVKRLMDHQEALHQKFIDEMERRDRERAGREKTWREQEVVLASREAAARANDRALTVAREAAIISFVEKITGETLNIPHSSNNYSQLTTHAIEDDIDHKKQGINAQGSDAAAELMMTTCRWPRSEVEALIRVRSGLEWRFQEPGLKGPLWEKVSTSMAVVGYQRSAKRCKEKWENINKYFRKAKEGGRKRSRNSKTCPYFQQLDQLYSKSSDPPPENGRKNNSDVLDDDVVLADDHDQPGLTLQGEETNQPGLLNERL